MEEVVIDEEPNGNGSVLRLSLATAGSQMTGMTGEKEKKIRSWILNLRWILRLSSISNHQQTMFLTTSVPSYNHIVAAGFALDVFYCVSTLLFTAIPGERPKIVYNIVLRVVAWSLVLVVSATAHWLCGSNDEDADETSVACSTTTFLLVFPCVVALWMQARRDIVEGGPAPSPPKLPANTTIVITGANAGIGKETVRSIVETNTAENVTIYMLCRNTSKGKAAVDEILQSSRDNTSLLSSVTLKVIECNLGSFASVREATAQLQSETQSIDILINNAGVVMKDLNFTVDGNEEVVQANHLGHFLLTALLLPRIQSRVILLSSSTYHASAGTFPYDDLDVRLNRPPNFAMMQQYTSTKWCNILHAIYLQEHYHVTALAVHPGSVRTDIVRNMAPFLRIGYYMAGAFLATLQKTPAQGAWETLYAMTTHTNDATKNDTATSSRCCWVNRKPHTLAVEPTKEQVQTVWDWSCNKVGLTDAELQAMDDVRIKNTKQK